MQGKLCTNTICCCALILTDFFLRYISNSDGDVINLGHKVFLQKEKVTYLESIVKIVSNKIWNIRATIDWIKFTQGQ